MMKDLIDVREVLGVASGNRISFIVEGGTVRIVNSAVYRSGSRAVRKRLFSQSWTDCTDAKIRLF